MESAQYKFNARVKHRKDFKNHKMKYKIISHKNHDQFININA